MKIECPYCYQHYELEKSEMDREVVCINCEQSFRVRDAVVLDKPPRPRRAIPYLMIGMGVLIALLLALNLWNWQKLIELRASTGHPAPAAAVKPPVKEEKSAEAPQTDIAQLQRSIKELRAENERLAKQTATLEQTVADLTAKLTRTTKQATAGVGAERVAALEESVHTLSIKIESLTAQQKLQDEYHKQLLKGLTDLRSEIQVLNIGDRLSSLEKKADEFDLGPVNRRIEKLDAIVNAMRTVR